MTDTLTATQDAPQAMSPDRPPEFLRLTGIPPGPAMPTAAGAAVKLNDHRHISDKGRGRYFFQGTWLVPYDYRAADVLMAQPVLERVRDLQIDSVQRYRELVIDQTAIARRLAVAQAQLAEAQAKQARLNVEGRAGAAQELVKVGKAIGKLQEDIAAAEQEKAAIDPLVAAAWQTAHLELQRTETRIIQVRRSEIRAEHAKILEAITQAIAPQLVELKRWSIADADANSSVADTILNEAQRAAKE